MNPNGNEEQRIYTKSSNGPIKVKATATLNGKPINPGEIVGQTGVLAVNYEVVNTQTEKQTVTYKDAQGNDVTQEVDVAAPIGGTVDIVLPQGFNEITAKGCIHRWRRNRCDEALVLPRPLQSHLETG